MPVPFLTDIDCQKSLLDMCLQLLAAGPNRLCDKFSASR